MFTFKKAALALATIFVLGSATLVATADASARGFGGGHGGGMRGGGFHGGGMRMGGMRMGGMRMGGMRMGGMRHFGGGHHWGGGKYWGGGKHWGGRHWGHRWGHWGHHRHWGWNRYHRWYPRYWGYRTYSYSAPAYVAPAYSAPTYTAPVSYAAKSAPVCYSCGGWTEDGGYMTYRKVINEQTGQPELKCVKVLDNDQQSSNEPQGGYGEGQGPQVVGNTIPAPRS
jgi:hypothetical protein